MLILLAVEGERSGAVGVRLVRGYVDQARRRLAEGVVLRRAETGAGILLAYQEPVLGPPDPNPLVRDTDPDSSIIKQKKVRKTLIPTVLSLLLLQYDFLSLKIYVNVPSKSNKPKNLKVNDENSRIRIRNRSKCARHCEIISYFYNFRDNIKNL